MIPVEVQEDNWHNLLDASRVRSRIHKVKTDNSYTLITNFDALIFIYQSSCVPTGHQELSQRVKVKYAACVQLYPPEDEHLSLETCRGEQNFMKK